jgi:hypothetical protein
MQASLYRPLYHPSTLSRTREENDRGRGRAKIAGDDNYLRSAHCNTGRMVTGTLMACIGDTLHQEEDT